MQCDYILNTYITVEDKRNHVKQEAIKTYNEIELLKSSDQEILKLAIIKANEFDTLDEVNQKFADVKLNLEMISEISVSIVNDFEKREKEVKINIYKYIQPYSSSNIICYLYKLKCILILKICNLN